MYVAHVTLRLSMADIGRGFGRDRTTVVYACHLIEDLRDDDDFDRDRGGDRTCRARRFRQPRCGLTAMMAGDPGKERSRIVRFLSHGPVKVREAAAGDRLLLDGGDRGTISVETVDAADDGPGRPGRV